MWPKQRSRLSFLDSTAPLIYPGHFIHTPRSLSAIRPMTAHTTPQPFEWFWCDVIHIAPYGLHDARRTNAKRRLGRGLLFGTAVATRSLTCERSAPQEPLFET